MEITIEFVGISRMITKKSRLNLTLEEGTTYQDIVKLLAHKFPKLVGQMIEPKEFSLYPSNMFSLNGERMIKPDEMGKKVKDGDRLILMSILAGG
jgi:molybdopterin converting factor small subunit